MLAYLRRSLRARRRLRQLLLLGVLGACACGPPTRFRRAALVPAPAVPPFHGEPLRVGQVEASAHAGSRTVLARTAEPGDPALWIPRHEWNASLLVGATDWLSVGAEGTYAHSSWAQASAHGTPPLANHGGESLYGAGPQLAVGGRLLDDHLFASLYLSSQFLRIPWSTWERDETTLDYRPAEAGSDHLFSHRAALLFGGRPRWWIAVFGGLAASSTFINTGFSDEPADGSTLRSASPSWLPFAGVRTDFARGEVAPFLRLTLAAPIPSDAADYFGPALDLAFGVRLF